MSEVHPSSGRGKRLRLPQVALGIAVAIILVMSILSVFLYRQSQDYHDAKYRAQYVISNDLINTLSSVGVLVDQMLDESLLKESRYQNGHDAVSALHQASQLTWAIEVMYLDDDEKNMTFGTMKHALDDFRDNVYQVVWALEENRTWDVAYTENVTLNNKLDAALGLMNGLIPFLQAGLRNINWQENPYSVVDGMSLGYIYENSIAMIAIF